MAATQRVVIPENPKDFFFGKDNSAYVQWADSLASSYPNAIFVPSAGLDEDSTNGAAVHWKISSDKTEISIALAVRANGWFGFGMSENGGMTGSDFFIFQASNPETIVDSHVTDGRYPITDECQDWHLIDYNIEGGYLMVVVRRMLDTGDEQDLRIIDDADNAIPAQRVIAAWGDHENPQAHLPGDTARGAIRWFVTASEGDAFQNDVIGASQGSFAIENENYPIKPIETEYFHLCMTASQLREGGVPLDEGAGIIGFDPIVTSVHLHHFTVYASMQENANAPCDRKRETYNDMVYVWAPGEAPLALPKNVALPIGGPAGFRSFVVQFHYDNPSLTNISSDSSGVRFYWTTEPREHEMGMLQVGDPFVGIRGIPVGAGLTHHSFHCPGECSARTLDEPVTVFREYLHMHKHGVSIANDQIRDGETTRTGWAQFFDSDQQGMQAPVQDPFQIYPGDAFKTRCFYRADENTLFGYASADEMCIVFLMYYPRKNHPDSNRPWACGADFGVEGCEADYEGFLLADDHDMERNFGGSTGSATCPGLLREGHEGDGPSSSDDTSASSSVRFFFPIASIFFALLWPV